jgi:hypothetical protein
MPITYFEGINAPVTLLGHDPWFYKGKGRWVMISNNCLRLSHWTLPTYKLLNYSTFCICEKTLSLEEKLLGRTQQEEKITARISGRSHLIKEKEAKN